MKKSELIAKAKQDIEQINSIEAKLFRMAMEWHAHDDQIREQLTQVRKLLNEQKSLMSKIVKKWREEIKNDE